MYHAVAIFLQVWWIGFCSCSDWLKKWCKILKPITKRSNAKTKQRHITLNTQVKTTLSYKVPYLLE